MNQNSHKGFTLIELLVVVAIIGILAAIILSALGDARAKARDARRESDINTIQTQLELYYLDNGRYPINGSYNTSNGYYGSWTQLGINMGYDLPVDPVNNTGQPITTAGGGSPDVYTYSYLSLTSASFCNRQSYILLYRKETGSCVNNTTPICPGGYSPPANLSGTCIVTNPY